jgi:hypothetical protein
MQQGEQQQ